MVKLLELCDYLNDYLQFELFPRDISQNGLQVEGAPEVHTVAFAVDARTETLQAAVDVGAQLLIVHHGLFWGRSELIRGPHYRRLRLMLKHQLGLYAAHLPLDAHPDVGNNAVLARALGLRKLSPWAKYKGQTIGVRGNLAKATTLERFLERVESVIQPVDGTVQHFGGGPKKVKHIGVITGDASNEIPRAAADGLDVLLTGEPSHVFAISAIEHEVHLVCGGHYATETFGVKALCEHLAERFSLTTHFLHHPTHT